MIIAQPRIPLICRRRTFSNKSQQQQLIHNASHHIHALQNTATRQHVDDDDHDTHYGMRSASHNGVEQINLAGMLFLLSSSWSSSPYLFVAGSERRSNTDKEASAHIPCVAHFFASKPPLLNHRWWCHLPLYQTKSPKRAQPQTEAAVAAFLESINPLYGSNPLGCHFSILLGVWFCTMREYECVDRKTISDCNGSRIEGTPHGVLLFLWVSRGSQLGLCRRANLPRLLQSSWPRKGTNSSWCRSSLHRSPRLVQRTPPPIYTITHSI